MSKKHPIPSKEQFRCWHCKHEFSVKNPQKIETDEEIILHAKCPKCGHTCTISHTNPMMHKKHFQ